MWLQTLLAMLTVLALMGICCHGLRVLKARSAEKNPPRIRVLESASLGDKRQLLLVGVGEKLIVVGSTPHRISALLQLDDRAQARSSRPAAGLQDETPPQSFPAQIREIRKSSGRNAEF